MNRPLQAATLGSRMLAGLRSLWRHLPRISLGLRGTIVVLIVGAALVTFGAMISLSFIGLRGGFNDHYRRQALGVARAFDALYDSAAELHNASLVQTHIERLMELDPSILSISVYLSSNGQALVLASTDRAKLGQPAEDHDIRPILTGDVSFYEETTGRRNVVEVLAPLHAGGKIAGVIGIYLDLAGRDDAVRDASSRMIAVSVLALVLLLLILYAVLNRLVLRPLSSLKRSSHAIEQGWLGTRVTIRRRDEFGEVAEAFNDMADSLEKRAKENQLLHAQLEEKYHQAQAEAVTDPVTGLYNHRHFQDRLGNELERAKRFNSPVALLFIDIDHFKALNDASGHQFGDVVLHQIAQLLKSAVREIDIVARYGGEEFTVILPGCDVAAARRIGERIRRIIASESFAEDVRHPQAVTVSIGIAAYPEDSEWRDDLIWKADHAMYYAKRLGRNQLRSYSEVMEPDIASMRRSGDDAIEAMDERIYLNLVHSLAAAVDTREHYDQSHSDAVARYSTATGEALGLSGTRLRSIGIAALLHDIGKIALADGIFAKTAPLSDEEWRKMHEHPAIGETVLKQVVNLEDVVPLIAAHHERFDGAGYQRGLQGEAIPLGARIIAVADAFHSMTSRRPFREALTIQEAVEELRKGAGTQFDPLVVEAFLAALEREFASSPEGDDTTQTAGSPAASGG